MRDHITPAPLAPRLARWLHERWRDAVPLPRSTVQLYALEVIDADGIDSLDPAAVRTVFIAEGPDEPSLLQGADLDRAFGFDALATVEHRWMPVALDDARPGEFASRRRGVAIRVLGVRP